MGIRGALGPVGCSDPSLQERVDRARPIRGAWARLSSSTLVSEILEANRQVRDPQPWNIRCSECILPRECRMVPSWLGSHGCGLCLKMATAVFAARVGTCVQPLQGENYMYSRVLGHV